MNADQLQKIVDNAKEKNLTELSLENNQISYEQISQLREELPNCRIYFE